MNGLSRILLSVLRLVFGVTFIVSGVLKLIDPVGTGLVISEYFTAFSLTFLKPSAAFFGVLLSILELIVGMAVLIRIRIVFFSLVALCLTCIFTIVTFILFKFNPIQDCGCFGEAIHLTNAQTFVKNLILLTCIVPIFTVRKCFSEMADSWKEWIYLSLHVLLALVLVIYVLKNGPVAEFGDFRVGTYIPEKMESAWTGESSDIYVYEKDGETCEFLLSGIPDSTWTFVEMIPAAAREEQSPVFDFAVSDLFGEYVTDTLLHHTGPVVLFSVYAPQALEQDDWDAIVQEAASLEKEGILSRVLVTHGGECPDSLAHLFGVSDYKTLISLSRINGGVVMLHSGSVMKKGSHVELDSEEVKSIIARDADETINSVCVREQIFIETMFLFLLLSMILFRFSFKFSSRHRTDSENI
ncbi:MAG: DoxX family protein [Alistipes sp.]|nr:DoxX family protein [Candidatus Minthomonas equi]